jgi:hypothetical protein
MRIRIIQRPSVACIDGLRLDFFEVGRQYEVGNMLGALMLSEQWAEPVASDEPALIIPLGEVIAAGDQQSPRNLIRETFPPSSDATPSSALDRRRRARNRPA